MNRIVSILFLFSLSCAANGQSIAERANLSADEIAESRFEENEELIMTVRIDNFVFGELFAIELEGLLSALDFPIYYNKELERYDGWFIKTDNTFSLAYSRLTGPPVIYDPDGVQHLLSLKDFTVLDEALYISIERLNDWFGLNTTVNFQDLK